MENVKRFVTRHPVLFKTALKLMPWKKNIKEFKSFAHAEKDIDAWVKTFPECYDLIIGIPRSGLYVASYLALKLGLPLSTPSNFIRGEIWFTKELPEPEIHKVLLVDDGVGRINGQMAQNYGKLIEAFPKLKITKAALYAYPDAVKAVDLYFSTLHHEGKNREEWNILHRKWGSLAVDMDGVLCHDWDPERYESYTSFLDITEPYLIPKYHIDFVITSREEQYRQVTIDWLNQHGVNFGELIMIEKQGGITASIRHKVNWLRKIKPSWYWESNWVEAKQIFRKTKIPVLCTENMELLS